MSEFRDELIVAVGLACREGVVVDHANRKTTIEPAAMVDAILDHTSVRNMRRILRAQSLSYANVNRVPLDAWLLSHRCDPAVVAWVLSDEEDE